MIQSDIYLLSLKSVFLYVIAIFYRKDIKENPRLTEKFRSEVTS